MDDKAKLEYLEGRQAALQETLHATILAIVGGERTAGSRDAVVSDFRKFLEDARRRVATTELAQREPFAKAFLEALDQTLKELRKIPPPRR